MSVLVVLEQYNGKWNRMSFEALAAGEKIAEALGTKVAAAVLGSDVAALAKEAATHDVEKVYAVNHALLAQYTPDGYTAALEQLVKTAQPEAVVFPHSYQVRDYAPKLATRFGRAFVSDVVDVKTGEGKVVYVRQLFQGKLNADIEAGAHPQFVSIQAGAFRASEGSGGGAAIEDFPPQIDAAQIRSKPKSHFEKRRRSVDLGAAELIVSVGRGIKERDNLHIVEELAQVLGAELAASRPICDNGWLPMFTCVFR